MARERDRYRRASLREQVGEALAAIWRNATARFAIALILAGLLIVRILTPEVESLSGLRTGDCVYLRPPGPSELGTEVRPVPATPSELQAYDAAERAPCDLSHSHEVSDAFTVGEPGAAYPGLAALVAAHQPRCAAAFDAYVGRGLEGSIYATAIAVPRAEAWTAGARHGVCLVFRADRALLDRRAGGSGR